VLRNLKSWCMSPPPPPPTPPGQRTAAPLTWLPPPPASCVVKTISNFYFHQACFIIKNKPSTLL
jgi:hypothetical protein